MAKETTRSYELTDRQVAHILRAMAFEKKAMLDAWGYTVPGEAKDMEEDVANTVKLSAQVADRLQKKD
jgi:hypothetical protein